VDILINNGGNAFNNRERSPDGLKLTWATNHLAPFSSRHTRTCRAPESALHRVELKEK
jgi:hypothetical protein